MCRLGKWLIAVLAIWMLAVPEAKAGVGFQPVSADELKMTSEPLAPGAPAIILYRQVDRDDNGATNHEDHYFRIKILTEEGRKHADVEIPFRKEDEEVVQVKARTIRPDGSIVNFDGKVFEKNLVKGRGVGIVEKTFTLPDVQVGSIIEYSYTVDDLGQHTVDARARFIYNSIWIVSQDLFTRRAQFSLKRYRPWSLRWNNHLPPGAVPAKEGPDHIVRMEVSNIPALQTEDYMPPPEELRSRVSFVYERKTNPSDQATYWKEFGKKKNGELESFIGRRTAMEQAVAQILSPNDSQEVKLRKIYDRVQQIRNTSYELLKTEQEEKRENEKSLTNAEEVWKRGYGDGRQLTWLFLGLARAAGFEAYGCWVSDRGEYFFTPVTLESEKLDANVVLIKLNGKDAYFEPGAAFAPFGLLPWAETGVPGLQLDKNGGTWIRTTLPQSSESRIERVGKLKLSDKGDLEGKVTVTYSGLEAVRYRLEDLHADEVERKKHLEDALKSQIEAASEVELANNPDWSNSETPLVAEFNLKIPGWVSNAGKRAMIPAAIFTAAEKGMFEHANRTQPVYFEYPREKADDVIVELPAGWQVTSVPQARDQDGQVVRYTLKVEQGSATLRLTRRLNIDIFLLEQKLYPALRNFFQVVRTGDGEQIVLQPGEIHASN